MREPGGGALGDLLQGAGLFEEMGCALDDFELLLAVKEVEGFLVQVDDREVVTADEEQGRGGNFFEVTIGEIGTSAARDDS